MEGSAWAGPCQSVASEKSSHETNLILRGFIGEKEKREEGREEEGMRPAGDMREGRETENRKGGGDKREERWEELGEGEA